MEFIPHEYAETGASGQEKTPTANGWGFVIGGGGGDRTPVRKPSTARSTYIVRLFGFNPRHANRTGLTQASHLEFRVSTK
jgi:hypothetical protein